MNSPFKMFPSALNGKSYVVFDVLKVDRGKLRAYIN